MPSVASWVGIGGALLATAVWAEDASADGVPSPDEPEPRTDVVMVHSLAVMTAMRTTEAFIWPEPFATIDGFQFAARYGSALTAPPKWDADLRAFEWDGDPWTINVLGHGLFGSELYMRARICHHNVFTSLVFATGASAMWEYAFEGNAVQPSGLDLWYTPLAGMVLGELRYAGWHAASGISDKTWRAVTRFILDPLGSMERAAGTPC